MTTLTASEATERHWCLWCPDLILPGEIVATREGLLDPVGEMGYAHADCAWRKGFDVSGYREPDDAEAVLRKAFRDGLHGEVPV